jgi:uncharacterized damage-inducible protein DinB
MRSEESFLIQARYNRWMNEKLYHVCAAIPDEQRKADLGAFFKSIHGTLNHLLLADRIWMSRLTDRPFHAESLDQELYSDFEQLRREREATDAEIEAWVAGLTADRLESELTFTSIVDRQTRSFPLRRVLLHLFNHQTHHRGQITTLLNQIGFDSGVTDLLVMPEE